MFQELIPKVFRNKKQSSVQLCYKLAQCAFTEQRYFEAVALYRTCLTLDIQEKTAIWNDLAVAYCELDLFASAANALKKADKISKMTRTRIQEGEIWGDIGLRSKLAHHTYARLHILSEYLKNMYGDDLKSIRLLDVGGGAGYLACFLPEIQYALAEPAVNNISAFNIPFGSKTFDCVLACHVFEHISEQEKTRFLDCLADIARLNVVLLNPFTIGNEQLDNIAKENLNLIWEVTKAPWAIEHIECGTPAIDIVKKYAQDNGYSLHIQKNSSTLLTALFVYMEHFAALADKTEEYLKINEFFNCQKKDLLSNDELPNDFICNIMMAK